MPRYATSNAHLAPSIRSMICLLMTLVAVGHHQMPIHARERLPAIEHPLHVLHRELLEADAGLDNAAAIMARHGDVLHAGQSCADVRFVGMHVQARGREITLFERIGQGVFVDEAAAGDVDEAGAAGEEGEDVLCEEGAAGEGGRGGEEEAVGAAEHVLEAGEEGGADGGLLLGGFADDVVVEDLHAEGGVGFLGDGEADVAEADDAEGVGARVAGLGGEGVVGIVELGGVHGAAGEGGPGHVAEDGDDVVEGHVADRFGGGARAVAVEDACPVFSGQHDDFWSSASNEEGSEPLADRRLKGIEVNEPCSAKQLTSTQS